MFTHLHNHTEASIADGLFHPKKWVEALKDKGFKAHAITDHGVMTYSLLFYEMMKKEKMIPILGCEFYYTDNPLEKNKDNRRSNHLVLIAKNYDGLRNLFRLSNLGFTEGFYFKPRIGLDWLRKYGEGLICLTACQGGVLSKEVLSWDKDRNPIHRTDGDLLGRFKTFKEIFGEDFYVEFQGHNGDGQQIVNSAFYNILRKQDGFQHVVTNDCHYITQEHAQIQVHLREIAYRSKNSEAANSYTSHDSLWLKSEQNIRDTFSEEHEYLPKAFVNDGMRNTIAITEKVKDLELPKGQRYLPKFKSKMKSSDLFRGLTTKMLAQFLKSDRIRVSKKEYIDRFKKEYQVITKHGLEDYFLIVWDLVRFAKSKGIYTGLGRGSAAGCFISYLLEIVRIDPLEHKLIFERFLNENRCVSGELPDIDLDFESERRNEIKDYIFEKYGREHVCEIGSYGRMKLKTSLLDFGKSLGIAGHREILDITTSLKLDKGEEDSLEAAMESSPELKRLLIKDLYYPFAVEEIVGQIKSQSIHPAGLVICSDLISEITPLKTQKNKETEERVITTQSEDKYIIAQGLMKMDILGVKEYDIIKYVIRHSGEKLSVDNYVERIMGKEREEPNEEVWDFFRAGKTEGVFQFSSDGMQGLLVDMQPDCINDLIAANALYRPGSLGNNFHTDYCNRKHGREEVSYAHTDVEKTLAETYGVLVYQEQFMEVIHRLGGISLVDSDIIRSALGKKDEAKLHKFKKQFVEGATGKIGETQAEELWEQIEKASGYTFNKSHSAAYSVLAYISQYLKIKHPAHFWAAHLEWDTRKNKQDEMLIHKRAALKMGIEFENPSVNRSRAHFWVDGETPVWSFAGIKGIGTKTAMEIQLHQPYKDWEDFYKRVNKGKVRFNIMMNLIHAGVFDEFGDRKFLIEDLHKKKGKPMHGTLASGPGAKLLSSDLSEEGLMLKFLEVMGFFERKIKDVKGGFEECVTQLELEEHFDGQDASVGGMLVDVRAIKTRKGDPMAFGTLVDQDENISLTFFPDIWRKFKTEIKVGRVVKVQGTKSEYKGKHNQLQVTWIDSFKK